MTLLIATTIILFIGTVVLRFFFHKVNPKAWMLGPGLAVLLFTVVSAGVIVNPPGQATPTTNEPSATAAIESVSYNVLISNMIHNALHESNVSGESEIRGLDIMWSPNGYIILVRLNIDSENSDIDARSAVQRNVNDITGALFRSDVPISAVNIAGMCPMVDTYGYMRDIEVLKVSMSASTAVEINWNKDHYKDIFDLCDYAWLHSCLEA